MRTIEKMLTMLLTVIHLIQIWNPKIYDHSAAQLLVVHSREMPHFVLKKEILPC